MPSSPDDLLLSIPVDVLDDFLMMDDAHGEIF